MRFGFSFGFNKPSVPQPDPKPKPLKVKLGLVRDKSSLVLDKFNVLVKVNKDSL